MDIFQEKARRDRIQVSTGMYKEPYVDPCLPICKMGMVVVAAIITITILMGVLEIHLQRER